jgi:hypothetical protein
MRTPTAASRQKRDSPGYVYFLVMNGSNEPEDGLPFVKVGITSGDVVDRIATLQTGNPFRLVCFDYFPTRWPSEVEHFIHRTHALDMHQNEWMRRSLDDVPRLVAEAKKAAQQIGARKSKEEYYSAKVSNGNIRAASLEELRLRADAEILLTRLVLAQLRLQIAANRLKAATGATFGIASVVRVNHIPKTWKISQELAESQFPDRFGRCCTEMICGKFQWQDRPKPRLFPVEHNLKLAAQKTAEVLKRDVLGRDIFLKGLTERTSEMAGWHDDFLRETGIVHNLSAKLADLQTDLILLLGQDEAIKNVCSFRRHSVVKFDSPAFCEGFAGAEQCKVQVAAYLKKYIYPARSYL